MLRRILFPNKLCTRANPLDGMEKGNHQDVKSRRINVMAAQTKRKRMNPTIWDFAYNYSFLLLNQLAMPAELFLFLRLRVDKKSTDSQTGSRSNSSPWFGLG